MATAGNAEFDLLPVVCNFRDEVTNPINVVQASQNPLIATVAIHDCPELRSRQRFHQFQIIAKGFQSDATPNSALILLPANHF